MKKKLKHRHRDYFHLSENDKYQYISQLSEIPIDQITYVLNKTEPLKENEFTFIVKRAQKIMESL